MATKLLLIEDVEDLGRSGDIVSAREGFARNYLLPRGLAVKADNNALRRQEALKKARLERALEDKKDAEELAKQLVTLTLTAQVKVDPEGNMYGSVSQQDIVNLILEQHGITLEKRFILLKHPIKEIGGHRVDLKLKEGVPAHVSLRIFAEGSDLTDAIEAAKSEEVPVVKDLSSGK